MADRRGGCCTRTTLICYILYMGLLLSRIKETTPANYGQRVSEQLAEKLERDKKYVHSERSAGTSTRRNEAIERGSSGSQNMEQGYDMKREAINIDIENRLETIL